MLIVFMPGTKYDCHYQTVYHHILLPVLCFERCQLTVSAFPIPNLYAIFFRKTAGWPYNGSALTTRDDWKRFCDSRLPSEFVIKPAQGAYGKGLNVFARSEKGFIDAFGKSYTAQQLYDFMLLHPETDSFVIQQRLKNHPELIASNTVFHK